ncbi:MULTISPECIES: TonB-dependent receptor [unclassified Janthinobacterium]|uniref:TonB-dependent siderophore receptor n=1 Tax=unclassified Janthinobacterium TaxID=2610881 RepID=UPI0016111CFD|nr:MULTISPECIES: TonB-dependent receptor [unclassified Janthinobacterium]MBB5608159.1 outer membrane receptor for ferric coprogen and ferric-rhodotorulic acid [Janthinobacterium sp. S3T4]MBB5613485.1 outer membrane receptor for ferric coprogen and ferric-rhodotorulic acid [Janthinobacterium sp. S3M3]
MRFIPGRSLRPLSILLALAFALPAVPPLAYAQTEIQLPFHLAADNLDKSLAQIARQAGVVLSYDPQLVRLKQAPAISGNYGVQTALRQALAGSGLELVIAADGTYTLRPAPATQLVQQKLPLATLAPVVVTGEAYPAAQGETSGTYTVRNSSSASRLNLSLRDTPQSVTVVTRQRIDDEGMKNLDDVLHATTGAAVTRNGAERSVYFSRGQAIDTLQVDGIASNISNAYSFDAINKPTTEIYDRVEIVRGANGLLEGAGNPSAAINMLRKRPTQERQVIVSASLGSWSDYRAMLDASSPLNEAKTLRGRSVLALTNANSYMHNTGKDNQILYGILEADLGKHTLATLGLSYQKDRNAAYDWSGLPTQEDGKFYPISRSTTLTGKWNHLDKRNTNIFADLQHQLADGWQVKLAGNVLLAKSDFLGNYTAREEGDVFSLNPRGFLYDDKQTSLDASVSGPLTLFGRQHELVAGASARSDNFDYHGGRDSTYHYLLDMNNLGAFNPPAPTGLNPDMWKYNTTQKQQGLYGAGRFSLTDATQFILGSRVSWMSIERMTQTGTLTQTRDSKRGQFTPYAGLVHTLNDSWSAYGSYTEIFKPQSNIGIDGAVLKPMTGRNYELGLKGEFLDRRLQTALAVFRSEQTGRADLVNNTALCPVGVFSCYRAAEKVRSTGIDIEASGALSDSWNISAGYTYTQSSYAAGALQGQPFATDFPRHLFKVASDVRLPGAMDRLRVGGSVYAQSSMLQTSDADEDVAYRIKQSGYFLTGLHAVLDVSKSMTLQLNIANALDKKYMQTTGNTDYWNFYGQPRTVNLALRAKF